MPERTRLGHALAQAKAVDSWLEQCRLLRVQVSGLVIPPPATTATMRAISQQLAESSRLWDMIRWENAISNYMQSAMGKSIVGANTEIAKLLSSERWRAAMFPPPEAATAIAAISDSVLSITRATFLAERSIERLLAENVEIMAERACLNWGALSGTLTEMTRAYQSLWQGLAAQPQAFRSLPPSILRLPSEEMYLASHLAEVSLRRVELSPEEDVFLDEVDPDVDYTCGLIESVDGSLVTVYRGAVDALESGNPDRVRHAIVSLRELITQVLHRLAPDNAFFAWDGSIRYLHDGRPTRRGRLLFICRGFNHEPLTRFADKNVDEAIAFLGLLQEGTHAVPSPFSTTQARALLARGESLIHFLIKISGFAPL